MLQKMPILLKGTASVGFYCIYERIRQWPVTDIGGWPLVNESSHIWRTSSKWIVAKYLNRFTDFIFFNTRDWGSDFKDYSVFYFETIHLREVSHQYPWLAYSFIYVYTFVNVMMRNLIVSRQGRMSNHPFLDIKKCQKFKGLYDDNNIDGRVSRWTVSNSSSQHFYIQRTK